MFTPRLSHRSALFVSAFTALLLSLSAGCKKKPAGEGQGSAAAGSAAATGSAAADAGATPAADAAPATPASAITKAATPEEAVAAADRTADDKALDAGRKPAELLAFLKVGPGMKAAEIFAGGGYTAELLARVVGPTGVVYGHNTKAVLEMFAEKPWSERLARLAAPSIVRVDRELDAPLPPEATDLDLVVMNLVYHDAVWLGADRAAMNGAIFKALKPGGELVVIDHSAKDGTGSKDSKDLHRIEAKFVKDEIEKSGFVLDRQSDLYKNAADTRDWNASPMSAADKRGTSDRFIFVFKKPADKAAAAEPAEPASK